MKLLDLPIRQKGIIKQINLKGPTKERLHSLGFIEEVTVTPIRVTPLGCPRIYRFMDTSAAIRNEVARHIEVEPYSLKPVAPITSTTCQSTK